MRSRQFLDYLAGIISRKDVGNNEFDFAKLILGKDGAQARHDEGGFITNGDDNGEEGITFHWNVLSLK